MFKNSKRYGTAGCGLVLLALIAILFSPACNPSGAVASVDGQGIRVEFDGNLQSRIVDTSGPTPLPLGPFAFSDYLLSAGGPINAFEFTTATTSTENGVFGNGSVQTIVGEGAGVVKRVKIETYEDFPGVAVFQVSYENSGSEEITADGWVTNAFRIDADSTRTGDAAPFWSYQPASYESRPDWILPLKPGFAQQNFLGMNATDYGGGTPVADVWRGDTGLAVGLLASTPQQVSMPIEMPDPSGATVRIEYRKPMVLKPGDVIEGMKTFVTVHKGDYFTPLTRYRHLMEKQGLSPGPYPETTYQPIWCAWGYEREFTLNQVTDTLPKVKELGFDWAVLDDGWQTAEGDWYPHPKKFPRGDRDMAAFVKKIHDMDIQAKLWWVPLAVDPDTDLIKNHPDLLLKNADDSNQLISWWDAYYLCPASEATRDYTRKMVQKIIGEWGYDGLKIDGQHLNGAPPCYNPEHNHAYPEEAAEAVPAFFKLIYDTAREIKPEAVVEICPCGASYSFLTMPFMNQPVASDPESSWQIRLKGKTFKALMGPSAPYYGDHVELSDGGSDFASTVGIGAVLGTKFTWPIGARQNPEYDLTAEKEAALKQWLAIYREKDLPHGEYLGSLYDLGFDRPETHAIRKGETMYYAFYAEDFAGQLELRGLSEAEYAVTDYVSGTPMGDVKGPTAQLAANFKGFLLLEATPK